jgi:hypothetical protein
MAAKGARESRSLAWLHRVREEHYRETRGLPVEAWLKPPDPREAVRVSRRLGLKVRLAPPRKIRALASK